MSMDSRVKDVGDIKTELLFDVVIDLDPPLHIGGGRTLFGAAGGTFEGPRLRGEVVAGGGDWAVFRPDGTMVLDVRLTLRTHDDALVHMTYSGRWATPPEIRTDLADPANRTRIDPASYYFRTTSLFETGDKRYTWLNDVVSVGSGYLIEGGVAYRISQVL